MFSTKMLAVAAAAQMLAAAAPVPRSHFVAPSGRSSGQGTAARPWDLATALSGARAGVNPGDTIWVRGGVYRGPYRSTIHGADGAPVVIRQYRNERVIIDGAGTSASTFYVNGDYTVVWGLEFTNSDPLRKATVANHDARTNVVVNNASHTKYINLIVHDGGNGFYTEPDHIDVEIAGCIVYNNGWQGPDRGHGHGLYLKAYTGPLVARDNVVFDQFGYGIHAYTNANSGKLMNIRIEGNFSFNNGTLSNDRSAPNILLGGDGYAAGDVIKDNLTYFSPGLSGANVREGYKKLMNGDVGLDSNYFAGGEPVLELGYWQSAMVVGNAFVAADGPVISRNQPNAGVAHAWRDNVEERRPSGTKVVVRPNPYEAGRSHIAVVNWNRQPTVQVDVSGILAPGDRYELRSVQDMFDAPIISRTFNAQPIVIPMRGSAPAVPVGQWPSRAPHTGSDFDVFILKKL